MTEPLIWLHEEALRTSHPVFNAAPPGTKALFVWDDKYLQKRNYSLKRLVFVYETLCELPVDIYQGDTLEVLRDLSPSKLYIPESTKPHLVSLIDQLKIILIIETIKDETFVSIPEDLDFKRFFKYWNQIQKAVLLKNGGSHA